MFAILIYAAADGRYIGPLIGPHGTFYGSKRDMERIVARRPAPAGQVYRVEKIIN